MGVQKFKKSIKPLGPKGTQILKLLGAGNKASDVAKTVDCVKSNVTYWKNKLLKMGAIRLQKHDVIKIYSLTPYGSKLLTGSEEIRETVLLEDHAVKFTIIEGEMLPIDWVKLGEPRNWLKQGVTIGSVKVVRTNRHIIIHPGQLRGFDVDELLVESGRIVERVKMILEHKFGMMLSSEGIPLHKPIFRFYSEEAKDLVALYGTTVLDGVGALDKSPPERIAHEEFIGRKPATERLLMPLRMKQIEKDLSELTKEVHDLVRVMREFVDIREQTKQSKVTERKMPFGVV